MRGTLRKEERPGEGNHPSDGAEEEYEEGIASLDILEGRSTRSTTAQGVDNHRYFLIEYCLGICFQSILQRWASQPNTHLMIILRCE